jgi:hypothetical protein
MLNKTTPQTTIHLEDVKNLNIHGFATAFLQKKKDKLPTPCEFLRINNLKHYRYSVSKKTGASILKVCTSEGKNIAVKERNFQMAYIKLVRTFNA